MLRYANITILSSNGFESSFQNEFGKRRIHYFLSFSFNRTLLNWEKSRWRNIFLFWWMDIWASSASRVSFSFIHCLIITLVVSNCVKILTNHFDPTSSQTSQILPTKMSYSANLKNVMSMENGQRSSGSQPLAEQELEASKPGPSPHDLAAQLKSSLLAEIGLTESDGPPLPSFR